MTSGSGTTRAGWKPGPGLLTFSSSLALLCGIATAAAGALVLVNGKASAKTSLVTVAFIVASSIAVLLARRTDLSNLGQQRHSVALGIGAAGALVAAAGVLGAAIVGDAAGRLQLLTIAAGFAAVAGAWPLARWLVARNRLEHMVRTIVVSPGTDATSNDLGVSRSHRWLVGVGIAVAATGLIIVVPDGPFGHDESIYALKAREWISGTPSTGWAVYRPVGMSMVGWVVLQVSSTEIWFRGAAIVLSLMTIATMWFAGRALYSTAAATVGTAVFVGTESFLRRATEFLNDVSSAGLMLAAMAVIWYHFERRPSRWWLVATAPLAAAAYYLRYGSALGLIIIAAVSLIVWRHQVVDSWRQIMATGGALLVLLLPHFAMSQELTGSALGIFEAARTSVGGGGGGLADYLGWLPVNLAGPVGAALFVLAGILFAIAIVSTMRRESASSREMRTIWYTMTTAVILTIALGAFTHGEPRFLYLPIMLSLLTGADALTRIWRMLRVTPQMVVGAGAAVVFAVTFSAGVLHMSDALAGITNSRDVIVDASHAVAHDADGQACQARSSYIPQITWYAGCSTSGFTAQLPKGRPAYLLLFEGGKRQPIGSALEDEVAATTGVPLIVVPDPRNKIGAGQVYRYP